MKVLLVPFAAYFLLMPYAALVGSKALGETAIDEWIIFTQILLFAYIIRQIKKWITNATIE